MRTLPKMDLKDKKKEGKKIKQVASYFSVSLLLSPFFCLSRAEAARVVHISSKTLQIESSSVSNSVEPKCLRIHGSAGSPGSNESPDHRASPGLICRSDYRSERETILFAFPVFDIVFAFACFISPCQPHRNQTPKDFYKPLFQANSYASSRFREP